MYKRDLKERLNKVDSLLNLYDWVELKLYKEYLFTQIENKKLKNRIRFFFT